jgi:hypothetical protein
MLPDGTIQQLDAYRTELSSKTYQAKSIGEAGPDQYSHDFKVLVPALKDGPNIDLQQLLSQD